MMAFLKVDSRKEHSLQICEYVRIIFIFNGFVWIFIISHGSFAPKQNNLL